MVEFVLKSRTDNRLLYEYYPQGDTEKLPGLISIWVKKKNIVLDVAAEEEFLTPIADEVRELKDSIDELYMALGEQPSEDEEWLQSADDDDWYYYAEKVMQRLRDDMSQGQMHKRGIVLD